MILVQPQFAFRADTAFALAEVLAPALEISAELLLPPEEIQVDTAPTSLPVAWRNVAGANAVEVVSASLTLLPESAGHIGIALGTLKGEHDGEALEVPIPDGPRPIRSLKLEGLEIHRDGEFSAVRNEGDLGGWRLAVAAKVNGQFGPVVRAAPFIPHVRERPALLTGASLSQRTLHLGDLEAEALRILVVEGGTPQEFTRQRFKVSSVSARAAPYPLDLEAAGPDGAVIWAMPGTVKSTVDIDLRNAVSRALETAAANGAPLEAEISLKARARGKVRTVGIVSGGHVIRRFQGKLETALQGRPMPLPLPAPPLESRAPVAALADVVVKHHGARLHPLSDAIPSGTGGLAGAVVGSDDPVFRVLPPQGLNGERLVRVGLVGIAPEATEIAVRILAAAAGEPAGPIGEEFGRATIAAPSPDTARPLVVAWVPVPGDVTIDRPIAIEAKAPKGRFLWVAGEDGPLVHLAVAHEPGPDDEVVVAGATVSLSGTRTKAANLALVPGAFAGSLPMVETDQLCTVVVSNLALRYRP